MCVSMLWQCMCTLFVCLWEGSEGLVWASGVLELLVLVGVVEVVRLVAVVAVADDGMLDAVALQLVLLVNALQLPYQLSNEGLKRDTHSEEEAQQAQMKYTCTLR